MFFVSPSSAFCRCAEPRWICLRYVRSLCPDGLCNELLRGGSDLQFDEQVDCPFFLVFTVADVGAVFRHFALLLLCSMCSATAVESSGARLVLLRRCDGQ